MRFPLQTTYGYRRRIQHADLEQPKSGQFPAIPLSGTEGSLRVASKETQRSLPFSVCMENKMYFLHDAGDYEIAVLTGEFEVDTDNDNVDVEVRFRNGSRYTATFFTIRNIQFLFEKNKRTAECGHGLYLYATDMIVVERLTQITIIETVRVLVSHGELQHAFLHIGETNKPEEV